MIGSGPYDYDMTTRLIELAKKHQLQYAVDKGIPVIGFGKQNVYEWLPEDCDVVFDTLEEAVDYIINYYD